MLRGWAVVVIVWALPVLALAQDNRAKPAPVQGSANWHDREGRFQGVMSTITAITGTQLSLKTLDGRAVTVNLSADTRYRKDAQPASLADFTVGDMVMVGGEAAGENVGNARFVSTHSNALAEMREGLGQRFIAGEIKSIDGTSLTILRIDGETQTIQVDENTSFRKRGESITLADFKPSDHVFGRGKLKNGIFVAAVLNLGDFPQMGPSRPGSQSDRH